jgi:hypothetical protein
MYQYPRERWTIFSHILASGREPTSTVEVGHFPAGHCAGCGSAQTESQALSRFNEIATVNEFDVDQEGHDRYTMLEWR